MPADSSVHPIDTRAEAQAAAGAGIDGVPFFVFGERLAVAGAQPESVLRDAIEQAITQGDSPAAAAARRDVVSRFSLERRVEAHLKLYRELFEAQAGVTPACVALPAQ